MNQKFVRRRSTVSAWLLAALCGVAVAPSACTIIKQEESDQNAGQPGMAGTSAAGEVGGRSEGGATAASAGTAGEAGEAGNAAGAGGEAGAPVMLTPPEPIIDGNVRVSCTLTCAGDSGCAQGAVFVSACDKDHPELCYEITPIDDPSGKGNTYIISVDPKGNGDVLEKTSCTATTDSSDQPAVDLLFAIDTTSSMGSAINGVVASIDSFVSGLAAKGVKMRIGGIAFGNGAPLANCAAPKAPFVPFTAKFGADTKTDSESFNFWLSNLSASHCGDGGGDKPEGGIDALEFALGHDTSLTDKFEANVFDWKPNAAHEIIVITDASQHQSTDGTTAAHYDLAELTEHVRGFASVHVVGPNLGCYNTPVAGCACDLNPTTCDKGCACDLQCATPACAADVLIGSCDDPKQTCDRDCAGFPGGVSCDTRVGRCDPLSAEKPTVPCGEDIDCSHGVAVNAQSARRCLPTESAPFADLGQLTLATGGAFTPLPSTGTVDLTQLPLSGVIETTEKCTAHLPADASAVRCVYDDDKGHQGEVVVELKK